jgi:FMN reductase
MSHLRIAVRQCYGWSLPYGVSIHPDEDFDSHGQIKNQKLLLRLATLGRDVVVYGQMIWEQFNRDLASAESETFAAKYR